jgi:hypothetical protein
MKEEPTHIDIIIKNFKLSVCNPHYNNFNCNCDDKTTNHYKELKEIKPQYIEITICMDNMMNECKGDCMYVHL